MENINLNDDIMNLNFEDGFKSIKLNGDENRVIRWNPADINFIDRFLAFQDWIDNEFKTKLSESGLENLKVTGVDDYKQGTIKELGDIFNKKLDETFNSKVSETAFCGVNPISPIKNGKLLFANLLDALMPVIENSVTDFKEARKKYTESAKKPKVIKGDKTDGDGDNE